MRHDFDAIIDRRGTHSDKWDNMQARFGISPEDGLAMWVADTDFRSPDAVNRVVAEAARRGVHGYFGDNSDYLDAVCGWMRRRHGWQVEPGWIATTPGLCSAVGLCTQAYSEPGDSVVVFSPVYHAFGRLVAANDRKLVESPLVNDGGRYRMDLETLEAQLTGNERIVIFCTPHNPGGRVWDGDEIRAVADFCACHDLVLVADEIHHDLVYRGHRHTATALAAPAHLDRMVILAAPSKTFNTAGAANGMAIIADPELRRKFVHRLKASISGSNYFGMLMTTAAYNEGEPWLEDLIDYLTENRRVFDGGVNAIPGVKSMELEATFLAWVDFSGTGMSRQEIADRVTKRARIAANHGPAFGAGGEYFMRFNLGCPRVRVEEAVDRLQAAFGDLQ
ncbi:MAG: MalY/PatB family protein [Paracoccaceae bacterium]